MQLSSRRVAIVTGGGRGMGRAIARRLAADGVTVVIGARTVSYGEDVVKSIREAGGEAVVGPSLELSDGDSCRALVTFAVECYGGLDILVLCAADASLGTVLDMDDDVFDTMVRSNFHSAFWFTKAAIVHLEKSPHGRVIYISSGSGNKLNAPITVPYGASKAALNAFARGVAHAYSHLGITFNCINPGLVASDRMLSRLDSDAIGRISETIPIARPGTTEEIADAVAFLAAPGSDYITGAELAVDGGSTLGPVSALDGVLSRSS